MKCDDCLNLLAEYIDGEVIEHNAEQVSAHLITCSDCANEFEVLTAEQEIFARYDRELSISPSMWHAIAARTANRAVTSSPKPNLRAWLAGVFAAPRLGFAFSGAMAGVIVAVVIGVMYLRTHQQPPEQLVAERGRVLSVMPPDKGATVVGPSKFEAVPSSTGPGAIPVKVSARSNAPVSRESAATDQSDVLFSDAAYSDIEDKATADHVEQAQNLLRSIRNLQVGDGDDEIDVIYEKTVSRRLLNENVVLRRDAEMAGKFPAKTLLGSLEPFLIDIANLPDKTTPNELRALKDRVQKTEIVAALQSY